MLARPANIILSSPPEVQRPVAGQCRKGQGQGHGRRQSQHGGFLRLMEQTRMGLAGYDPDEDDMRGIFMAKGPGSVEYLFLLLVYQIEVDFIFCSRTLNSLFCGFGC